MNPHDNYMYRGLSLPSHALSSHGLAQPPLTHSLLHYTPVFTGVAQGCLPPEVYPPQTYVSHLKAIANHILASDARIRARRGKKSYADHWSQAMITKPVVKAVADTLKRLGGVYCGDPQGAPPSTTFPVTYPNSYKQDRLLRQDHSMKRRPPLNRELSFKRGQDHSFRQDHRSFGQHLSFGRDRLNERDHSLKPEHSFEESFQQAQVYQQDHLYEQHSSIPMDNEDEHINVVDVDDDHTSVAPSSFGKVELSPHSASFPRAHCENSLTPPLSDTEAERSSDRDTWGTSNSKNNANVKRHQSSDQMRDQPLSLTKELTKCGEKYSTMGAHSSITKVPAAHLPNIIPSSRPQSALPQELTDDRPIRPKSVPKQVWNSADGPKDLREDDEILNYANRPIVKGGDAVHTKPTVQVPHASSLHCTIKPVEGLNLLPPIDSQWRTKQKTSLVQDVSQIPFELKLSESFACQDSKPTGSCCRDKLWVNTVKPCERYPSYAESKSTDAAFKGNLLHPKGQPSEVPQSGASPECSDAWPYLGHQFVPKQTSKLSSVPFTGGALSYQIPQATTSWLGFQPATGDEIITHTSQLQLSSGTVPLCEGRAPLINTVSQSTPGASVAVTSAPTWHPVHQRVHAAYAPKDTTGTPRCSTAAFDALHARTANGAKGPSNTGDLFSTKTSSMEAPFKHIQASEQMNKKNALKRKSEIRQSEVPLKQSRACPHPKVETPSVSELTKASPASVTIGSRGTLVRRDFYDLIPWDDSVHCTKLLMQFIFDFHSMATLTVDGQESLDPDIVHDIAEHVATKCGTPEHQVLDIMKHICSVARRCYEESNCT